MLVYVVRHCQSENNALKHPSLENVQRKSDPSLTKTGFEQRSALYTHFLLQQEKKYRNVSEIWTSPMLRCLLTAKAVKDALKHRARCFVHGEIFEHGGCFEGGRCCADPRIMGGVGRRGMTKTEIKNSFEDFLVGDELTDGWWDKSRAVETVVEAQARAEKVAEQLWARARGRGGIGGSLRNHDKDDDDDDEEDEDEDGRGSNKKKKRKIDDDDDDDADDKKEHGNKSDDDNNIVGDLVIVSHGMFTDILLKILLGVPKTIGRQSGLFCSQNAGIHVIDLDVSNGEENICGLLQFNDVRHIPEEYQTGGSVFGLDECYVSEGSA